MEQRPSLLIFGASVRAAAFSAVRAGFRPWCADLFADADLRARCECFAVPSADYPRSFLEILARTDVPGPWMYTGGLENYPDLVREMCRLRPLWGNGPGVLTAVRAPTTMFARFRSAGLPVPADRIQPPDLSDGGRWLLKPRSSAGGSGIRFWDGRSAGEGSWGRFYFQEFVEGEPYAAVYAGMNRGTILLGVTRQLVGERWLHAAPFHYCGSVGPVALSPAQRAHLLSLGNHPLHLGEVALGCGIRGLFGIDFILHEGVPWPVEINPRYSASIEVLEHVWKFPALAFHRAAFVTGATSPSLPPTQLSADIIGKAVYFASKPLVFPGDGPWQPTLRHPRPVDELPAFADIPGPGQSIQLGRPVLTFFARADTVASCLDALRQIAKDLDRWLFGA